MKKLLIIFFLFLVSCSKDNIESKEPSIPVNFTSFSYCYLGEQFQLTFVVEENKTVKYYTIDGSVNNTKYVKIAEVISEKTNGSKKYDVMMSKKAPPYYFRINVFYTNGLVETLATLSIE